MSGDFILQMAACSQRGRRKRNEDRCVCFVPPAGPVQAVLAVADGMGGEVGGAKASKLAIQTFQDFFLNLSSKDYECLSPRSLLRKVYAKVNNRIFSTTKRNPKLSGMGTTLVSAIVMGNQLVAANVGDSRIYHIFEGAVTQISRDHNMLTKMLLSQRHSIRYLRRREDYLSSCLLRSLGEPEPPKVDIFPLEAEGFPLQEGEVYLLCSDGLTGSHFHPLIEPADMVEALEATSSLQETAEFLVQLSYRRGSDDNITVVLLKVQKRRSFTGSVRLTLRRNGKGL